MSSFGFGWRSGQIGSEGEKQKFVPRVPSRQSPDYDASIHRKTGFSFHRSGSTHNTWSFSAGLKQKRLFLFLANLAFPYGLRKGPPLLGREASSLPGLPSHSVSQVGHGSQSMCGAAWEYELAS